MRGDLLFDAKWPQLLVALNLVNFAKDFSFIVLIDYMWCYNSVFKVEFADFADYGN